MTLDPMFIRYNVWYKYVNFKFKGSLSLLAHQNLFEPSGRPGMHQGSNWICSPVYCSGKTPLHLSSLINKVFQTSSAHPIVNL